MAALSRELLDWINAGAFQGAQEANYLAFLHASGDPNLGKIVGAVFSAASFDERNEGTLGVATPVQTLQSGKNNTFAETFLIGSVCFATLVFAACIQRNWNRKEMNGEVVVPTTIEHSYAVDISDLSVSSIRSIN